MGLSALVSIGCARTLYNFGEVESGRIYRSAQPSPLFLRYVLARERIRSIVNLRGRTPGYESAFAARHGLRLFSFDLSASEAPTEAQVQAFLDILREPANHPVLVHCRSGVDRTGYMIGIHRLSTGWTAERAVREMQRFLQFSVLNGVPHRVVRDELRRAQP